MKNEYYYVLEMTETDGTNSGFLGIHRTVQGAIEAIKIVEKPSDSELEILKFDENRTVVLVNKREKHRKCRFTITKTKVYD